MHMSDRYCIASCRLNIGRIKFGIWAQNHHYKKKIKFGGYKGRLPCQTAKFNSQPNFWLYGMYLKDCDPDHSISSVIMEEF